MSPATVQAVDMDNSSCSVLWNENDAFKNDRSDSSGGRGADSRAMRQVSSRPVSISDVGFLYHELLAMHTYMHACLIACLLAVHAQHRNTVTLQHQPPACR